jgi:polyisoprenyl-teichoic acid--peptidoglycan teichoic acid transferase
MIVLIVSASNLPAQLSSPQASLSGSHDFIALAAPGDTPTAPIQVLPTTPTNFYAYIPRVSRAFPTEIPPVKPEVIATQPAPTSSEPAPTPSEPAPTPSESTPLPSEPTPTPTESGPTPTVPASTAYPFIEKRYQIVPDQPRSWSDYPGPSLWPDLAAPAPVGILAHPEDQINILLLGSDQRPGDGGFRTDTIQLLTINPAAGTVKLTAFPRDLYVYIPGYTVQRINTAFGWGGFDALADTMEYNFGVRPDYYVLANFNAFVDGVNSIGGIFVDVGRDFCDHMDAFDTFCVSQSTYWMNGRIALWYVRARYTTSDLDRGRRQQEVLEAVFKQLIGINGLYRIPELYDIYKDNVTTDVDFKLITQLLPIAAHLADSVEIGNYAIGRDQVYDWINYSGAMVLVPMREPVLEVMRQAISEP